MEEITACFTCKRHICYEVSLKLSTLCNKCNASMKHVTVCVVTHDLTSAIL